jgi:hypothetical protein
MFKIDAVLDQKQVCHKCCEAEERLMEHGFNIHIDEEIERPLITLGERAIRADALRRILALRNSQLTLAEELQADIRKAQPLLTEAIQPSGLDEVAVKSLERLVYEIDNLFETTTWQKVGDIAVPLNFQPGDHLIDRSYYTSPDLMIIPPCVIPHEQAECGICWNQWRSVNSSDGEDACSAGCRVKTTLRPYLQTSMPKRGASNIRRGIEGMSTLSLGIQGYPSTTLLER